MEPVFLINNNKASYDSVINDGDAVETIFPKNYWRIQKIF